MSLQSIYSPLQLKVNNLNSHHNRPAFTTFSAMKKRHIHGSSVRPFFDRLLSSDHPCDRLLSFLSTDDLLSLRLTSQAAARFVDRVLPNLFETLYAKPLLEVGHDIAYELGGLQHYCKELVIRYPHPTNPINAGGELSLSYAPDSDEKCAQPKRTRVSPHHGAQIENLAPRSGSSTSTTLTGDSITYWRGLFGQLPNLAVLTISCPGQPPWPGYQAVEKSLVAIRQALESTPLPSMSSLRLDPIHAIGILHLRWAGATAFEGADWMAGTFWSRIRTLDIGLMNPAGLLAKDHQRMFIKVLHDYLGSFSGSIEELRFRWLGASLGPNPLFLEQVMSTKRRSGNGVSSFSAPLLRWGSALKTITLQGCDCDVVQVRTLFDERAPGLKECRVQGNMLGPFEGLTSMGIRWREEIDPNVMGSFIFWRVHGAYNVREDFDISQDCPDGDQDEDSLSDSEEGEGDSPIIFIG